MSQSQNDYLLSLERVAAAARCLKYSHDFLPGEDLGAKAIAVCWIELRSALSALLLLEDVRPFDAQAALQGLLDKKYP